MRDTLPDRVRLGVYELDVRAGELRAGNRTIRLQEQPLRILLMLIDRDGEIVTREQIQKKLWPNDTVVEFDHSINAAIRKLRQALEDPADRPIYIETVARRGYRLLIPVVVVAAAEEVPAAAPDEKSTTVCEESGRAGGVSNLIGKKVSHYRVLQVVGGGGMGMVYRAEDLKLGRQVALKFLPEELAWDPVSLQRFEREARTASLLDHPNLCTIYEVEEYEDQPFLVMQFLEGETLASRLAKLSASGTTFGLEELLDIAIQICHGMQAAHEKGIMHRDIKPANIFLTGSGQVKILDFGLAKLMSSAKEPGSDRWRLEFSSTGVGTPKITKLADTTLTRAGATMGTAGYMSPEQVRGEKLDARSDIFSFGLVLYEMATGHRAFGGDSAAPVQEAILNAVPEAMRDCNSAVPSRLQEIVDLALQKDREQRYQSVAEMRADLQNLRSTTQPRASRRKLVTIAAILAIVAIASAGLRYWRSNLTLRLSEKDTIVLADFANTTGDPVFDDALKTALAIDLRQSPVLSLLADPKVSAALKTMNRSSGERLTEDLAGEVCRRTNSTAVVASSISDVGNQYRIELKAVNCHTGAILARAEALAESRTQVIRSLGDAGTHLREQLGESREALQKFNQPLDQALTASPEALVAYMQAARSQMVSPTATLSHLRRAVELDPNFAAAYAALGVTFHNLGEINQATENLTKAYQSRDRLTQRQRMVVEAQYYSDVTGELDKVVQTYNDMDRNYPGNWTVHNNLGGILLKMGEYEKSISQEQESLRLMPDTSQSVNTLMVDYNALNESGEAKALYDQARARNADGTDVHATRYISAFLQGDKAGMQEQLKWAASQPRVEDPLLSFEADTEAYYGRVGKARELTKRAVATAKQAGIPETMTSWEVKGALIEAEIGNADRARQQVTDVLARGAGPDAELMAALTLARAGETQQAQLLAEKFARQFPLDTLIQGYWLPTIHAAIALDKNQPQQAIAALQGASRLELASPANFRCATGPMYPSYVRGLAYLKAGQAEEAEAEFQMLLDHPGVAGNYVLAALAHLQLARARAMIGNKPGARAAYQDFLELWSGADPDLPVYKQAKLEHAKLQLQ